MPGLTLNTSTGAPTSTTPIYPPPRPISSQTPVAPAPIPAPAPATATVPIQQAPRRSSSPQRPPYSPITPPLNPVALPPRPAYTHASQRSQTASTTVRPPPPEPIDFDANPDALALKSAISILQLQRRKAQADMAALSRAKAAALAEPDAFVRDLASGRVRVEGEGLFVSGDASSDSSSDDDDDDEEEDEDADMADAGAEISTAGQPDPRGGEDGANNDDPAGSSSGVKEDPDSMDIERPQTRTQQRLKQQKEPPKPWAKLPKPQNVVRCPPINWSQYAVVGESLDKLHAEQVARPSQGVPATLAPDGRYEFKGEGKQEKLVGIAAPYMPGKDRLDKKPRGPKR
ncbi:hypothetical protein GGS26DRAFT_163127 [Hypomontagnella submonticulosa]|nr:hypothetical protein GGS26DRAFT_163127 [Hypomontagnella submonticulosa]